jgi:hypothetical protein
VVDWPLAAGRLADARACLIVRGPAADRVLAASSDHTVARQAGLTYQVTVRVVLPGAERC